MPWKEMTPEIKEHRRFYMREYMRKHSEKYALEKREIRKSDKGRDAYLKKYNMTHADYVAILARQGGVCAICETDDTGHMDWFSVDHDHKTGHIRGLLCHSCNVQLLPALERYKMLTIYKAKKYLKSDVYVVKALKLTTHECDS